MKRSRRSVLSVPGPGMALTLGGCAGPSDGSRTPAFSEERSTLRERYDELVGMESPKHNFVPEDVTIEAGGSVVWLNDSEGIHTVTAYEDRIPEGAAYFASGGFESEVQALGSVTEGELDTGETDSHTFEVPGTYHYYCIPHEESDMIGTVVVEE